MELTKSIFSGINEWTFKMLTEGKAGDELRATITALSTVTTKWYPEPQDIFRAFRELPVDENGRPVIRVVIVGQDPYHDGSADGLAFSCRGPVPPSLRNIYKCLVKCGLMDSVPTSADLTPWSAQGVLMMNTALSVVSGTPKSHSAMWDRYTTELFRIIAGYYPDVVFMCWGNDAKSKLNGIPVKHLLTWGHPSPISAFNKSDTNPKSFVNCDNFTKCNEISPVDWGIIGRNTLTTLSPNTHDYLGVDGGARANGKSNCRCSWGYCYLGVNSTITTSSGLVDGDLQSNNRGELTAIIKGMEFASTIKTDRPLIIVCDSKYTIGIVKEWGAKWFETGNTKDKKNLDLVKLAIDTYKQLTYTRRVTFVHVNSHIPKPSGPPNSHAVVCWVVNDEADKANQQVLDK